MSRGPARRTRPACAKTLRLRGLSLPATQLLLLLPLFLEAALTAARAAACVGTQRSILVVGAGMAGVTAAHNITLSNPCFKVTVLEARDRVGGRMYSREGQVGLLGTVHAEMGGQWIQSYVGNPITDLAKKFGLPIGFQNGQESQYSAQGRAYSTAQQDAAEAQYQALRTRALNWANQQNNDVSVDLAFRKTNLSLYLTPFVQARVAQDFEFEYGGLNDLSAWYFDDSAFGGGDALVTNGYDQIPKRLMALAQSAGAKLVLNFPVTSIAASATGVAVTGKGSAGVKTYSGDAVIVTAPLGVLKAGALTFTPALSARKTGAISRLGFGTINKVAYFYATPFWDTAVDEYTLEDATLPGNRGKFVDWRNLKHPEQTSALLGISVGQYTATMVALPDATVQAQGLAKMAVMFPAANLPANKPLAVWIQRWNTDPYARGSYTYAKLGVQGDGTTPFDFDIMAEPAGRVLFAGEHTSTAYRASVHGAYLTGLREAKRVLTTF